VSELTTAIVQASPSLGVAGVLVTIIALLIRRETRVDASHASALDRQVRLHATEIERLNRDHDAELIELNTRIRELRRDLDELDRQLSAERAARLRLPRRGVAALDLDLDTCTVTVHYTDGTDEVRPVVGCADVDD
jgi:hypothetical protein